MKVNSDQKVEHERKPISYQVTVIFYHGTAPHLAINNNASSILCIIKDSTTKYTPVNNKHADLTEWMVDIRLAREYVKQFSCNLQ